MPFIPKDLNMNIHWVLVVALVPLIAGTLDLESSVTTESLVTKHGYPFEEHQVQTADGYVLTIHRIPYSSRVSTPSPRPVAFLMHGVLSSSSCWVLLDPEIALGFILSDAGYDVWMGNARGSMYSREHVRYSPLSSDFWKFDWHEIGTIDTPAMIDYAQSYTGEDQVTYFGHSQGTTTFLLLNSVNLEFKSRIKSAHLLAPVVFMDHMESPLAKIGGPLLGQSNAFMDLFGSMEFLPNTMAMELLGYTACIDSSPVQALCSNALFLICGFDQENLNTTIIPEILATTPAGASANQIIHYLQEYNSGYFREFDYGWVRNLVVYRSTKPPSYPLEKIDVPIFLYYGGSDYLASVVDVHRLIDQLSDTTLRRAYLVPNWNHLDFLWALNITDQLYDTLMEDVASIN